MVHSRFYLVIMRGKFPCCNRLCDDQMSPNLTVNIGQEPDTAKKAMIWVITKIITLRLNIHKNKIPTESRQKP